MDDLLDVRCLETQFRTREGTIHAVNGVSFTLKEVETSGIAGVSGCRKSVTDTSVMRLIPSPPGYVVSASAAAGRVIIYESNYSSQINIAPVQTDISAVAAGVSHFLALRHNTTKASMSENFTDQTDLSAALGRDRTWRYSRK